MNFNLNERTSVEFVIFRGLMSSSDSVVVPVDGDVQDLLLTMVENTRTALGIKDGLQLQPYEPSQDYGADSRLALSLDHALATVLKDLFEQDNRPTDAGAMSEPGKISSYGCIVHDQRDCKLVAIKRAAQFKGVLKARLIRFVDDTLKAVPDTVFKLDVDFDLLIVDNMVYIQRVPAFELLAEIDEQVRLAAVSNTKQLGQQVPFLNFGDLTAFVSTHKRAARVVAALRARDDLHETSPTNFRRECRRSGVLVRTIEGRICPEPGHELGFLQMLDRRRYAVSLIPGKSEQYEANSRKQAGIRLREGITNQTFTKLAAKARPATSG